MEARGPECFKEEEVTNSVKYSWGVKGADD